MSHRRYSKHPVAGLDPATHVFSRSQKEDVDARVKPGQGD